MAARQFATDTGVILERLLWTISDNARLCLIAGLAAGLAFPALAAQMQAWLPLMIAMLLTITALRIGRQAAKGALRDLRWGLGSVMVLQLAVPLVLLALCHVMGLAGSSVALAMVLATAAPAISGSANLALLLGQNAGRMMQILIMGTAAFPVTVLPLLILMPALGTPTEMLRATGVLLLVICAATAIGFALRQKMLPNATGPQIKALDGLSVLAFSAIVIGLMAALNPALRADPILVVQWAVLAFAISYGLQVATYLILRKSRLQSLAGPLAIGAGNRNIALFLVALPPEILAPLMIFVGCWQLPMYLTPILLRPLYKVDDHSA